jgi:hypothetical protein
MKGVNLYMYRLLKVMVSLVNMSAHISAQLMGTIVPDPATLKTPERMVAPTLRVVTIQ